MTQRLKRLTRRIAGHARSFWWGVVRSERAQRRLMQRGYMEWTGKDLHPDDLDQMITEQRPNWRRAHR